MAGQPGNFPSVHLATPTAISFISESVGFARGKEGGEEKNVMQARNTQQLSVL